MPQKIQTPQRPTVAQKPVRLRVVSELGQSRSLASGHEAFARLDVGAVSGNPSAENTPHQAAPPDGVLFLGLGPDPAQLPDLLRESGWSGGEVYYLECPEFAAQMPPEWWSGIPGNFRALSPLSSGEYAGYPERPESIEPVGLSGTLENELGQVKQVWQYAQSARLFPSFWGPLLGGLKLRELGIKAAPVAANAGASNISANAAAPTSRHIILVGTEHSLLYLELCRAFQQLGYSVSTLPPTNNENALARLLRDPDIERPALFFSLNCEGYGALGENFHLLKLAGIPCATWFVDNPWYSLSGLRAPFWKQVRLFCTDASFVPQLKACGAAHVEHLPLAVDPRVFAPPVQRLPAFPLLFVGRSAFPGKERFFAGLSVPPELTAQALNLLEQGRVADGPWPDFHWWTRQLGVAGAARQHSASRNFEADRLDADYSGVTAAASERLGVEQQSPTDVPGADKLGPDNFNPGKLGPYKLGPDTLGLNNPGSGSAATSDNLWLGKEVRRAGLGAENATAVWRTNCLKAAMPFSPVICGDAGWHDLLPAGVKVHEPVDYYHGLPQLYAAADFTLNATSLLLPAGLNQRHFDVWAAGGFLLTDYNPGLDIFPEELVKAVSFRKDSEIPELLTRLRNNGDEYQALKKAWREEILARHCYVHRVEQMLEILAASSAINA